MPDTVNQSTVSRAVWRIIGYLAFNRITLLGRERLPLSGAVLYVATHRTESGGPLSHGAVTAREVGLPAVMSVRGVLEALENSQIITVDGTAGRVVI